MHVASLEPSQAFRAGSGDIGALTRAPSFRSIPDAFTVRAEGIRLQSEPQVAESAVLDWCERAHDSLSFLAATDPSRIWVWQEQVLPILLASGFLKLCREQRFGNGCDRVARQMAVEEHALSNDRFGRIIDAWGLDQPGFKSIRNESTPVDRLVRAVRANIKTEQISIVSLGCGPLAQALGTGSAKNVHFTVIDNEQRALNGIARDAAIRGIGVKTIRAELTSMAGANGLAQSYAAFCGLHSLNYLTDAAAIKLLNLVHSKLRPSGRLLLGNFLRGHPNAALFEYALHWPLLLRSEPELLRLIKKTSFAKCAITLSADPEGTQLFIECRKSAV